MRARLLVPALAVAGAAAFPLNAHAQSEERITAYDVTIDVLPSGRIHVVETIDRSFGSNERHGIFRTIPVRFRRDADHDRVYPIRNVRVTGSRGTPLDTKVSTENGQRVIRIGDEDRTITGDHQYVISYDVDGAVDRYEGHDELFWNAIGPEWDVPISRVSVTVRASATIENVACYAGPRGSRIGCGSARADGSTASFGQGVLVPFAGLSVVVALPHGYAAAPGPVLEERWSADKAFARSPAALGLSALVLLGGIGSVGLLTWKTGRDRHYPGLVPGLGPAGGGTHAEERVPLRGRGAVSVDFTPGDGMRPALMGVLLDEQADPLDVTATIVDLAVRGYLTIEELPRKGLFRRRDWKLTYLGGSAEGLAAWEGTLLSHLFPSGTETLASKLKNTFFPHLRSIQGQLYDDVVAQGWFTRRPDKERGRWHAIAIGVLVAGGGLTFVLARFTTFGLVGVAAVLVGLVLLALHKRMPFRTARGTAARDRALAFRRYLVTAESEQLRFEEREGVFARYLPYAVVFGETERWANAFKDLDSQADALRWYSGPSGWSFGDFGDSITSFSTSTAGSIASTPGGSGFGSGFGGGGGSGGGGGGGGGGSW